MANSENQSVRVAIVGPTGYTGLHLLRLLARHERAAVTYLASHRDELPMIGEHFPQLVGLYDQKQLRCRPIDIDAIADAADAAFLCLPHKAAMAYAGPLVDAGLRVIDLSADYRLHEPELYEQVYHEPHTDPQHLAEAVYGLPELFRDHIPGAALIANPGCYPTAAALALAPLLQRSMIEPTGIMINASSGVTGAGRKPKDHLHYPEQNESYFAYGTVGGHRHQPEIEQTLTTVGSHRARVLFVPHLLPIDQGILETIYATPIADVTEAELAEAYEDAYGDEAFIRLRTAPPNVKHCRDTNFCDLFPALVERGDDDRRVVVFSAIDNMVKGASGQAVQNMNLMFDLPETMGLM